MVDVGSHFGRFEIEARLGSGGMGEVYLARDPRLGRRVALKVVGQQDSGTDANARLLREARAAAALEHPNVVVIYEVDVVEGTPYIAMEHVRGRSLREMVTDEATPLTTRLDWLEAIADTLAAAHRAGVVHRDIKPENVMVREDGAIKVLDFGIARQRSTDASAPTVAVGEASANDHTHTAPGMVMGTPAYMAPEQIRGEAIDARVDQFGWGVLAYEVLVGRLPWSTSAGGLALVAAVLTAEPPALDGERLVDLPVGVEGVLRRAMAKSPDDRHASMSELVADLRTVRSGAPAAVAIRTAARSRSWVLPGLLGVAAVAIALIGLSQKERADSLAPVDPSAQVSASASVAPSGSVAPRGFAEPATDNPEARAAYLSGLQAFRDGAINDALSGFERASRLDPGLAAAHLRLALLQSGYEPVKARATFTRARELRSLLNPFDQDLLEAVEPRIMRETQDHEEVAKRLATVVARHPNDPEGHFALGLELIELGRHEEGLASLGRTIELDPTFTRVLMLRASVLAFDGDFPGAYAACDEALERASGATFAFSIRAILDTQEGRCADLTLLARRWKVASPSDCYAPEFLANAMASTGAPGGAVEDVLSQRWALLPQEERAAATLADGARLAAMEGDFVQAEAKARELKQSVTGDSEMQRAEPYLALARIFVETGRDAEARKLGEEYFAAREGWTKLPGNDDYTMGMDARPLMIALLRRAGDKAELYRARRDAWLSDWRAKNPAKALASHVWMYGYPTTVGTEADAKEALAALSADLHIPPFRPFGFADPGIGRMYLLLGRFDDAIAWYERATRSCNALALPFEHTRAWLELGLARQAKGDKPGACAAFDVVLDKWGRAKPRSVTADEARKRRARLRCQ